MDLFEEKSLSPMLIAQMQEPFNDDSWIYELKLDGCRLIAVAAVFFIPDAGLAFLVQLVKVDVIVNGGLIQANRN